MKTGTNAALMRRKNEKIILSLINREPVSRAEISKITGLTRAAVTIIVDELISKGYLSEMPTKAKAVGRRPVHLYLNGDALYTVGINISREGFSVGISDLCGTVVAEEEYPLLPPDEFFAKIGSIVEKMVEESRIDRDRIYGIGVVAPGPVDTDSMKILNPPNFDEWHNVEIVRELQTSTNLNISFANVSGGTALAEKYFGAAKRETDFIALRVDRGIGSGIVINGDLFDGINELGHTSVQYDGVQCECGNRGCLEKYASVPKILEGSGYSSWKSAVDSGDRCILEKEAEYLSAALINVNNLFNLEKVILCSELGYKSEIISGMISKRINGGMLSRKNVRVCGSEVSSKALVAAAAAVHSFFTEY